MGMLANRVFRGPARKVVSDMQSICNCLVLRQDLGCNLESCQFMVTLIE